MSKFKKQLLFIIIGVAIIASGVLITVAVNNRGNEPYIYLKMDEGVASTTYDASGNSNNGTLQGGAAWKNEDECVSGKCLYLDGTGDYVSIPDFSLE